MDAVGVTDPARCVYVGDRLYDDIWGAQQAGMRAVHIPLSDIPAEQAGTTRALPTAWSTRSRRSRTSSRRGDFNLLHCTNMRHEGSDADRRCVA